MNPKEITHFYPENCPMALFLDLDNLTRYDYDFGLLLDALKPWGKLIIRRAYAVQLGSKLRLCGKLHQHGFQTLEVGTGPKRNRTDMRIVMEMMEVLHRQSAIKTFVICSGDGDFIEAIRCLRDNHKAVIGVAARKSCSEALIAACDRFLFLEDLTAGTTPRKHEAVARQTRYIRTSPDAMRTWLRKCNLMPPDPQGRRQVLRQLETLAPLAKAGQLTYGGLQDRGTALCAPLNLSRSAVRHVCMALLKSDCLAMEPASLLLERRVTVIPTWPIMEAAVAQVQLRCLLSCPDLVADPVALAEVIWDEPQRAPEMEKLIETTGSVEQSEPLINVMK